MEFSLDDCWEEMVLEILEISLQEVLHVLEIKFLQKVLHVGKEMDLDTGKVFPRGSYWEEMVLEIQEMYLEGVLVAGKGLL